MNQDKSSRRSLVLSPTLIALVFAGEAIFFLPFVIARVFRPTLLEVFQITNYELGVAFSVYGVIAMIAYFPGGPLADAFPARKLMSFALMVTAAGGLAMATIPELRVLKLLYGYWGITTILLFWAALIRATRELGGEEQSATAFGLVDGGRGLVAALMGSIAVYIFASLLPVDVTGSTLEQRSIALQKVILVFAFMTAAATILVWFFVPNRSPTNNDLPSRQQSKFDLAGVLRVLAMPVVWLQAVIIVCAYVGFKSLDYLSLFATDVLKFDEVSAAYTTTISMWIRPIAAVLAGLLADRTRVSWMTAIGFGTLGISCCVFASGVMQPGARSLFLGTITVTSVAVFALRGLYFALLQEGKIPFQYTGTAVGIVSVIGYTPDIFLAPLMGYLLDDMPGELGHQWVFGIAALFAFTGLITTLAFFWFANRSPNVQRAT